jgi:hypothetical protein
MVFLNLSDHASRVSLLDSWVGGKFNEVFIHFENDFSLSKSFEMKAWEWMVWVKE